MAAPDRRVHDAAAHWLAVSDPEPLDELASGDSAWPMLCCAATNPGYVLARAATAAGLLPPTVAYGAAALSFVALGGGTLMEAVSASVTHSAERTVSNPAANSSRHARRIESLAA